MSTRPSHRAPDAAATTAAPGWPPPAALDDDAWHRARRALMDELAHDLAFAPHCKLVAQQAFDDVRADILRGRPLVAGSIYTCLRHEPQRTPGFSARTQLAQGPAEQTLLLLFAAAAGATAEPHLDRSRVYSAQPPRPGDLELVAPGDGCAGRYRQAVAAALADPARTHAVELDIARAGRSVDRARLLADLARMGLPAEWQAVGGDLDRALAVTLGRTGIPGSIGSGQLVTIALRPLDAACAACAAPSFRLVDDLVALADGPAEAARVDRALAAVLTRQGLAANPGKSGIGTREALARRWQDAETQAVAALPAAPDAAAAGRAALGDPARFGRHAFKAEQWAFVALGRARDPFGLELALSRFASAPWAARLYAHYIALFVDDREVAARFARSLASRLDRLHPWQVMWALSVFWTARAVPNAIAGSLSRIAAAETLPATTRATAAIVWARIASGRGWTALEELASGSPDSHLRAAVAFGFRYRSSDARRTTLARWARLDPNVALVASALRREAAPS